MSGDRYKIADQNTLHFCNLHSSELDRCIHQRFCNVSLHLIGVFRMQSDIKWGGTDWNGTNIDYLHFEISESKIVEYLKKP